MNFVRNTQNGKIGYAAKEYVSVNGIKFVKCIELKTGNKKNAVWINYELLPEDYNG